MATMIDPAPGRGHWVTSPEAAAAEWLGGYRGSTRRSYGAILRRWLWWCQDSHLDPWLVSRIHIERWMRDMPPHAGKASASVVCGFYRDSHGRGYTPIDLAWGVRRPRAGRRKAGTFATPVELRRILAIAEDDGGDTWALVAILVLTGARIGETVALDIDQVEERDPLRIRFECKGHHIDVLTMPETVRRAVAPLLARRTSGKLLRWEGRVMTYPQARAVIGGVVERAECEQDITPHSLRRSFVTLARDRNG